MTPETRKVMHSSASVEWETPPEIYASLYEEFGPFTLDPACTAENRKAYSFFTREDDGLAKDWVPHTTFLNPPYGRDIGLWVAKAARSSDRGALVVCLLPSRTGTKWWHEWVQPILDGKRAGEVRFLKGRLKFGGAKNSAPFDSVVVVFKPPAPGIDFRSDADRDAHRFRDIKRGL